MNAQYAPRVQMINAAVNIVREVTPINDSIRLITGRDPETGAQVSRMAAAGWIALEFVPGSDAAKAPKLAKYLDTISDLTKGAKAADKAKDVKKTVKAIDTAKDTSKASKTKVVSEYVGSNQKLLPGPDPKAPRLEAPKAGSSTNQNKDFNNWLNKGQSDNSVYYGIDATTGDAVYTGITKQGLDSRLLQHNRQGKNFSYLDAQHSNLTRNQARAVEQYLIEHGDASKLNQINSISPKNKMYENAMSWAENYLNGGN